MEELEEEEEDQKWRRTRNGGSQHLQDQDTLVSRVLKISLVYLATILLEKLRPRKGSSLVQDKSGLKVTSLWI